MPSKINIAIDGPSGSGKSTTAKFLAKELGFDYLDTGSMYRAITWYASKFLDFDLVQLEQEISELKISFKIEESKKLIQIKGFTPGDELYSNEIAGNVSNIAKYAFVRDHLVKMQKEIASQKGYILDGRDIGTVVLPDAELKIFLVASLEKRSERRLEELEKKGIESDYQTVYENLRQRDQIDTSRVNSPLKKAYDAIEISTDTITLEEQVEKIKNLAIQKMNNI